MTDKIKAIVVGSNDLTGDEGLEVIKHISARFPPYSVDCWRLLNALLSEARDADACLVLQDAPPQVLIALLHPSASAHLKDKGLHRTAIGSIMPSEERSATKYEWRRFPATRDAEAAEELVLLANPNAKTEIDGHILTVTVTKPEFSHIEWL